MLTIFKSLTQKHRMSLHLLHLLQFLSMIFCSFQGYKSCASFVEFIPIFLSDVIIPEMISFSHFHC